MEIKIKYESKLVPKGFIGITLYPTIHLNLSKEMLISYYGVEKYLQILEHEKYHWVQQRELSVLKTNTFITGINFYILYVLNWMLNVLSLVRIKTAYRDICFEREACYGENFPGSLKERKKFGWVKFII